jgi:hypothetical protein
LTVAKTKSLALVFELLESRCLLNGAFFEPAHLFYQPPDISTPTASPFTQDAALPRDRVSTDFVENARLAQTCGPQKSATDPFVPQDSNAIPQNVIPQVVSATSVDLRQGQDFMPSIIVDPPPVPVVAGLPAAAIAGDVSVVLTEARPALQNSSDQPGHVLAEGNTLKETPATSQALYALPAATSSGASKNLNGLVNELAAESVVFSTRHPIQQAASGEEDIAAQRLTVQSLAQTFAAKEPSTVAVQIREQSTVAAQGLIAVSPTIAKEDRAVFVPSVPPSQTATVSPEPVGQGLSTTHVVVQNSRVLPSPSWSQKAPSGVEGQAILPRLLASMPALPVASAAFELGSASSSTVLTNILPANFSGLESAIKDFFEEIDQVGLQLSESQVSLLFSTSVMAAAAALALEVARRKLQPRAVTPALGRAGSIPYSDYL